jgi:hypothetical protein
VKPVPVHRRLRDGWGAIAGRFGFVQTLVILAICYAALLGPMALVFTVARRDLLDKRRLGASGSAWCRADTAKPDLERAKLTT